MRDENSYVYACESKLERVREREREIKTIAHPPVNRPSLASVRARKARGILEVSANEACDSLVKGLNYGTRGEPVSSGGRPEGPAT